MTLRATAAPLTVVTGMLQMQLGRKVVDKISLDGLYDFELTFSPEGLDAPFGRGFPLPPPGAAGPAGAGSTSQPTASDPVEVLVVDSVESRPPIDRRG